MPTRASAFVLAVLVVAGCASDPAEAPSSAPGGGPIVRADQLAPGRRPPAPGDRAGAVTQMGRMVLGRSAFVFRGRVEGLTAPLAGMELAEVRVLQPFAGDIAEDDLVRVYCGEQGRLPRAGQEGVLFVGREAGSLHPHLVEVAPLDDRDAGPRLHALAAYLEIEALEPRPRRMDALLAHLRLAAVSPNLWTRHNALREYAAVADREPEVLGTADAAALSTARVKTRDPGMLRLLDSALSAVRTGATPAASRIRPPTLPGATSQGAEGLLRRYQGAPDAFERQTVLEEAGRRGAAGRAVILLGLEDDDPQVRATAAEAASAARDPELGAAVHTRLLGETELPVRGRLVRATGMTRFDGARATLVALASARGPLSREALFALARIRTDAALEDLRQVARDGADPELRELVEFLLSDAFLEQEKRLRGQ